MIQSDSDVDVPAIEGQQDGLADMMTRILNQNVGDKVPVLAKRKSNLAKEVENDKAEARRLKKLRIERKAQKTKQMVIPDQSTMDFERQLRKLATRGVVALFNAISKHKRESDEAGDDEIANSSSVNTKKTTDTTVAGESKPVKQVKKQESKNSGKGKWNALNDDYMLDKQLSLKNWDKAVDDDDDGSDDGDI